MSVAEVVAEPMCLSELPPSSENFRWHVVPCEPEPEGEGPVHADSDRARWLHEMYSFLQQQISMLQAQAWEVLQEIQNLPRPPLPDGSPLPAAAAPGPYEVAEAELMARNKITRSQADRRLDEAEDVAGLATILQLVKQGRLDSHRAAYIAWRIGRLLPTTGDRRADGERRRRVVDAIADRAPDRTTRQLAWDIRKAVNEVDPDALRAAHEREKANTFVRCGEDHAGMGVLDARLDDRAVATIDTVLNLLADAARNAARRDHRPLEEVGATHGQRRANAFAAIFTAVLDGTALRTAEHDGHTVPAWWQPPALPTRKRRRPHLVLTVDTLTLLGLENLAGDLAGYGAISPDLARQIAKQCGTVDVLCTGGGGGAPTDEGPGNGPGGSSGTGTDGGVRADRPGIPVTDVLRTGSYQATAKIHSRVGARFRTCRFPSCDLAAHDCDTDHVQPYAQGGTTSSDQMIPLCRRHHRMKTHTLWIPTLHPDGTVEWRSPTGQRFRVRPG